MTDPSDARVPAALGLVYPVALVVKDRPCLVVGAGRVAARKIASLLECGAAVTVVAPEAHVALGLLSEWGVIEAIDGAPLDVQLRPYRPGEATEYRLVIAATGDAAVDGAVYRDAEQAGVWVNSADDPAHCTFVLPAVWRQGRVSLAVSTGGASPALAGWLRGRAAQSLGPNVDVLADLLAEARRTLQSRGRATHAVNWSALLDSELPDLVSAGRLEEARTLLSAAVLAASSDHDPAEDQGQ